MLSYFLGIDIGSISTKLAVMEPAGRLAAHCYLPTAGDPLNALEQAFKQIEPQLPPGAEIAGIAVTGSGRNLAAEILQADLVKNEITCQALSAAQFKPEVRTVIEIGGQDSKLIVVRDGLVAGFGMNSVCAAGTGSFLDHQAARLAITLSEMGRLAEASHRPAEINATCTVFAESDMITKQQSGLATADIVYGLCKALVANFRRSVIGARPVKPPVVFQGGVAYNLGIRRALTEELGLELSVPSHPELSGSIGAALLCIEQLPAGPGRKMNFDSCRAALIK